MALRFGPQAAHDGHIQVFVSESVIRKLGLERISPEPVASSVGNGGVTYTFPASGSPAEVDFRLEPSSPGSQSFTVQVAGSAPVTASVFVVH